MRITFSYLLENQFDDIVLRTISESTRQCNIGEDGLINTNQSIKVVLNQSYGVILKKCYVVRRVDLTFLKNFLEGVL